ncbi:MAG: site-2 protease family protein [Candidatus Marsarchaeota archaeon]|nr:site-2 protease family protein [Candidatus Marsarchaeota archaeon]MCL5413204.1 site-2 protease family protein [Candidatus Marsarchaeota archaeon]
MAKRSESTIGNAAGNPDAKRTIPQAYGIFVAILCLAALTYLYLNSGISASIRIIAALLVLLVGGEILAMLKSSQRLFYGIYMIRSRVGLRLMDRLAGKGRWFWNGLADWGLVLGFGLLSYVIFKRDISKKTLALGIASILVMLFVVLPFAILPFSFINIPQVTGKIQSAAASPQQASIDYIGYALYGLSVVGGFVLYVVFSLAYNAASILYAVAIAVISSLAHSPNYGPINNSIPGVAPIIPGITIPLFAGILSLALLLAVHEFSHGVLSRIAKVRVKSSGALMFGIIPIGAFVEPDEKAIGKLNAKLQNRISSAGISSNMLLSLIMFVPMILMYFYVMPNFAYSYVYVQGTVANSSAYNVIVPGSVILKWNGYNISTLSGLMVAAKRDLPHTNVSIVTNRSSYVLQTNAQGKVGVEVNQGTHFVSSTAEAVAYFLYTFFGLSFLLNFLAAVVNFLPIPSFDGWRIFNTSIKSKRLVKYITLFVVVIILLNVVPWFWTF